MANPINFKPKSVDPKFELQRRLATAPNDHAEALLAAFDLLEEAHRQGVLDALHGAIGAKDTIVGLIADYSAKPASVKAIRNLLALGQLLGSLNPEPLSNLSKEMADSIAKHQATEPPPGLWQIFRRLSHPDARRGLSLMTSMLAALGRAIE